MREVLWDLGALLFMAFGIILMNALNRYSEAKEEYKNIQDGKGMGKTKLLFISFITAAIFLMIFCEIKASGNWQNFLQELLQG